jgi:hypothetical protein
VILSELLGGKRHTEQDDNTMRTTAELNAALNAAMNAAGVVVGKLTAAQCELDDARREYDTGVQAYALDTAREPNRIRRL